MPQSVTIDEIGRIRVVLTGNISRPEFEAMFTEIYRLEAELDPLPDRITDASAVITMETSYDQMLPAVRHRSKQDLRNSFRNALIAVTPMQYGLARMFQSLNTNPKIEIRLVRSMDEALAWLAEKPAIKQA